MSKHLPLLLRVWILLLVLTIGSTDVSSGIRKSVPSAIGNPKLPVLLVEFTDKKFSLNDPKGHYQEALNGEDFSDYGAWGSVKEWFIANSGGRFSPEFDIIGPVTLSRPSTYYGGNNSHGDDMRPKEMIADALRLAVQTTDFSQYDNDYDGLIDFVYIYYAGQGEDSYGGPSTPAPRRGSLMEDEEWIQSNGLIFDLYASSNEWMKEEPAGIGPFIFEICRWLGLPSLSEPGGEALSGTPGQWDIMDLGYRNNDFWCPPNLSGPERLTLGWIEPRKLMSPTEVTLAPIGRNNEAVMIPLGNDEKEYYLLEYRFQESWDTFLPNQGLLIWHIDYDPEAWEQDKVNHLADHHRVRLIKANNIDLASYGNSAYETILAGWCYPGTSGATILSDTSLPAMRKWNGEAVQFPITKIEEDDEEQVVRFIAGDAMLAKIPVGIQPAGDDIDEDTFIASWQPVEEADGYLLSVYPGFEKHAGSMSCDFGTGIRLTIPNGWESSSALAYTSPIYYGESSPSLRFKDEGAKLISSLTEAEITELSFWAKGVKAEASTLMVSGLDSDNRWHVIAELSINSDEGERYHFTREQIPADMHQIKWQFHRFAGSLALDDIHIVYGEEAVPCEGYDNLNVGTDLSHFVDNLPEDEDIYYFTVRAVHGENISEPSEPISVLLGRADVETITTDPEISVENGIIKSNGTISVYTPTGLLIGRGMEIPVHNSGVYFIVGEGKARKVVIG